MADASLHARTRAVTWRSVLTGLVGVLFLCGLSPYNDWVIYNTLLVGNFMPVGLLLFFLIVVLCINAPLRAVGSRLAMSGRELTVSMAIVLVACGMPGAGMMRYLPPQLVGVWKYSSANPDHAKMVDSLQLPDWLFPRFQSEAAADRASDAVVAHYFERVPEVDDSFTARAKAVPWAAWRKPIVAWGIFSFAFLGAMACLVLIVRRQWVENERLPFPLAGIFAAVVEEPPPGRAVNDLFRTRSFWIAFVAVFLVHSCNAMYRYDAKNFPEIRIRYELGTIFANEPWVFLAGDFKNAALMFCIVGITYFLPSQISLSSWVFYVAFNVMLMITSTYQVEWSGVARADEFLGGCVPYALAVVWIGRNHWRTVFRQMMRGWREGESRGRYLPYAFTGWALVGFIVVGVGFLTAAGMSLFAAAVCFFGLLTLNMIVARIVAETGLPFVNLSAGLDRAYLLPINTQGEGPRIDSRSYFLTQMTWTSYSYDMRESSAVYMSHALKMGDDAYDDIPAGDAKGWRRARPFLIALVCALVVGFFTAGAAKLYTEYSYATTLGIGGTVPDSHGSQVMPPNTLNRSFLYQSPTGPPEAHNRVGHFVAGGAISTVLSIGRLKWAGFPLHPVGFLLSFTWPMSKIWFSVMIGWFLKTLIVAYGGTPLYRRCREFFLGMILGDAFVSAFWLVVALVLSSLGMEYKSMFFLPP